MMRTVTAACAVFALNGCGGPSGSSLEQDFRNDPRFQQLEGIGERAHRLLGPTMYADHSITAEGITVQDQEVLTTTCGGTTCVDSEANTLTIADLFQPDESADLLSASIGSRGGFTTGSIQVQADLSQVVEGVVIRQAAEPESLGFWGEFGYGCAAVMSGPLSGPLDGVPFSGCARAGMAVAFGEASGSNPAGLGSAEWAGIAEAVSTQSFQRQKGTSTLQISDLSDPRLDVSILIAGREIGSSAWSGIPLTGCPFQAGRAEHDFLQGSFMGSGHEEAYGVFDTDTHVGAFGALRRQQSGQFTA